MQFGAHVKSLDDIAVLRELGFDLGEVVLKDRQAREYWRASDVRNGLGNDFFLIAHGPREGPPNDPDNLWNNYRPALRETLTVAAELGARLLTVHLWMDPRFVKPELLSQKREALGEVCRFAAGLGVVVSLENLSEDAEDLRRALDEIPELSITLDVGHGQLLTGTNTSYDIIDKLIERVGHVHLHDNRGGGGVKDDLHLPIGSGIIDFPAILGALVRGGYDGTMTLELEQEDLRSSLERVKKLLAGLA
jgi:sugar phosphate isomerase/epimerase